MVSFLMILFNYIIISFYFPLSQWVLHFLTAMTGENFQIQNIVDHLSYIYFQAKNWTSKMIKFQSKPKSS